MDEKYYCNRCIIFHCHSSRKFPIHLASIAVANSDLFCIFAPPYSMTCIRLWFLNFTKVTNIPTYVNSLSIPYRLKLVWSKLVHKRAGNTWSKKYLKFIVFYSKYIQVFENLELGGIFLPKKSLTNFKSFKTLNISKIRDSSYVAHSFLRIRIFSNCLYL